MRIVKKSSQLSTASFSEEGSIEEVVLEFAGDFVRTCEIALIFILQACNCPDAAHTQVEDTPNKEAPYQRFPDVTEVICEVKIDTCRSFLPVVCSDSNVGYGNKEATTPDDLAYHADFSNK